MNVYVSIEKNQILHTRDILGYGKNTPKTSQCTEFLLPEKWKSKERSSSVLNISRTAMQGKKEHAPRN